MKTMTKWFLLASVLLPTSPAIAVDPPGLMNYQGVLRNTDDEPLDGSHDMIFRFYDDPDPAGPENEIFVDEHLASGTGAVTVTGGLFDVLLGSGNFYDGSGPGDHPHIFYVFGLHETVYLEVQVGAERLEPRMQVVSAPYAIHAVLLGGYAPSEFLNTTGEEQEKTGLLRALGGVDFGDGADDDLTAAEVTGLTGGPATYADFLHQHAYADNADTVDGKHADEFIDTSSLTQTKNGSVLLDASAVGGVRGIDAKGPLGGGYFRDSDQSGQGLIGSGDYGLSAWGNSGGGWFYTNGFANETYIAIGDYGGQGVHARGDATGGYFETSGTGRASVAIGDRGIEAFGAEAGGYFEDNQGTSNAHIAYGNTGVAAYGQDYGIYAEGDFAGGVFEDASGESGHARIAVADYGVDAKGDRAAGQFINELRNPDLSWALLAHNDFGDTMYGVYARGGDVGGRFISGGSGVAELSVGGVGVEGSGSVHGGYFQGPEGAEAYVGGWGGYGYGVAAFGDFGGGIFKLQDFSATAQLAYRNAGSGERLGIWAKGADAGGRFFDDDGGTGEAYIAYGDRGMWGAGTFTGGTFSDTIPHTNVFTDVARTVVIDPGPPRIEEYYKVFGNGTVSFVQNHPGDPDRVVVYAAPEGDEVATYTRGTARLEAGEARIPLGSTFQWVTNPDVGLTAHLTPHGDCLGLYVESLNTDELVVRELGGGVSDVRFDYFVMGLRIGYEQAAVVQAKDREAPIPSAEVGADYYTRTLDPGLHTPLQRFRQMEADVRGVTIDEIDLSGAMALRESITAAAWQRIGMRPEGAGTVADDMPSHQGHRQEEAGVTARETDDRESAIVSPGLLAQDASEPSPDDGPVPQSEKPLFPVSGPVEVGDLLALDPDNPEVLRRADAAADPNVIGIVVEESNATAEGNQAMLALYGLAVVNADASHGAILPGDLLISSPTPGHAMRATVAAPGTTVGKALEPLENGTGSIRVLVMPR